MFEEEDNEVCPLCGEASEINLHVCLRRIFVRDQEEIYKLEILSNFLLDK